MPYNSTALPPREEPTGTAQLPLSRVKKMIAVDNEIIQCSSNATFVITLAAEMFIQYLAEQGHNVVKSERKPRRNIQYRDLATAVSHADNLEFLSDLIPKTVPYSTIKANITSNTIKKTSALDTSITAPGNANGDSSTGNAEGGASHGHPTTAVPSEGQSILNGVNGFAVRPGSKSGIDLGELVNGGVPSSASIAAAAATGPSFGNEAVEDEEDESPEKQLERENERRMSVDGRNEAVEGRNDSDRMQH